MDSKFKEQTQKWFDDGFKAGQQSKQVEIDELQNSIGVLEDTISYALKFIDGDKYPHAIKELEEILK